MLIWCDGTGRAGHQGYFCWRVYWNGVSAGAVKPEARLVRYVAL